MQDKLIADRLETIAEALESERWSKETTIDELRHIADEMNESSELLSHNKINDRLAHIRGAKSTKVTYLQLENEIFKMMEELDERIFEDDQNEKLIFQFQCEKRGIEKVLETIEMQKGNREIL